MITPVPTDRPVEIGRYYLVPCIRLLPRNLVQSYHIAAGRDGWIPVLGPKHEDAELIGFPNTHLHVDLRFVDTRTWQRQQDRTWRTVSTDFYAKPITLRDQSTDRLYTHEHDTRQLRAKRQPSWFPRQYAPWIQNLSSAFAECTLKPGNLCPHRGLPLAPFADARGIAVCPGHGLAWNLNSGRLATDAELEW
jgi:hypothetical protein